MIKTTEKIFEFLKINGFKREEEQDFIHFYRDLSYGIDFDKNNLNFTIIAEEGDIFTIPNMRNTNQTKCMIVGFFTLYPVRGGQPWIWKKI